jgi:hypothetical protein
MQFLPWVCSQPCDEGKYADASQATVCSECQAGEPSRYQSPSIPAQSLILWFAGYEQPRQGKSFCSICANGTYSPAPKSNCIVCKEGSYTVATG